jgi:hypothetical protein
MLKIMDISQRYIFTDRHTCTKAVDMLLHVTAGKLIRADNGETTMGRFTGGRVSWG